MDDTLVLLAATYVTDANGVRRESTTRREVFCRCESVSRTEFFDGGRSGLNPEFMFTVFAGDYAGESLVEYHGQTYSVYRTYRAGGDYMELYVQRKGGTNGKNTD